MNAGRGAWLIASIKPRQDSAPRKLGGSRLVLLRRLHFSLLADMFAVFMFVVWFWLLITVFNDLFRRHDISGWVKAIWVIALIVFPTLGSSRT